MVKCLTRGLRGFNGAVQRRLATLTLTMLISSSWQLSSAVELRRIFDVCKRWANSGSHEFVKKNMLRYMRPHGRFAHCSCKNAAFTLDLGLLASAAGSCGQPGLHLQCANRPFWPLVSKYTILEIIFKTYRIRCYFDLEIGFTLLKVSDRNLFRTNPIYSEICICGHSNSSKSIRKKFSSSFYANR